MARRRDTRGVGPGLRACALGTLVLLAAFYWLRPAAAGCSGPSCDVNLPFPLVLPLTAVAAAAVTAGLAWRAAWPHPTRAAALAAATALGVAGPLVALTAFRDRPDAIVPLATALLASVPLAALAYAFSRR